MQSQETTMLSAYQEFALSDLEKGRFKEALEWTEKAQALIEKLDQPIAQANCLEFASFLLGEMERYDEAIEVERALSICLEIDEQTLAADSESILALHLHRSGRSEEAAVRLHSSEARYRGLGDHARAAQCVSTAEMWAEGIDVGLKVGPDQKPDV